MLQYKCGVLKVNAVDHRGKLSLHPVCAKDGATLLSLQSTLLAYLTYNTCAPPPADHSTMVKAIRGNHSPLSAQLRC